MFVPVFTFSWSIRLHVDLDYVPSSDQTNSQPKVHFIPWICKQHSRQNEEKLPQFTYTKLPAGWSWLGMWQGWEIVFGPDTFREGQTVTLCQPGRTRGTAMLNTISWSANGREFVVVFGGIFLFVWLRMLEMCVRQCLCISIPCSALCINTTTHTHTHIRRNWVHTNT